MKTDRMKNLSQRYSLDEFRMIDEVKRTYRSGYVPVVLRAPDEVIRRGSVRQPDATGLLETTTFYSLRFYYALRVWEVALALTDYRLGRGKTEPFTAHEWRVGHSPFRELHFAYPDFTEMTGCFWQMLAQVAESHAVWVCEGINCFDSGGVEMDLPDTGFPSVPLRIETRVVVDTASLRDWEQSLKSARKSIYRFPYNRTLRSYSWPEIRDYFIELSVPRIALLNGDKMNRHTPADDLFLSACYRLDADGIDTALKQGAEVFALTDSGESCLQRCVEGVADDSGLVLPGSGMDERTEVAVRLLELLLEKGADIDLFGYDGVTALTQASVQGSVRLVRFLLDRGADPNLNCRLTDYGIPWFERSTALNRVLETIADEGDDPAMSEVRRLLVEAGARSFTEGYRP